MTDLKNAALTASAVLLAVLILATLVRAVIGPRFTDRVIAVNMINTMAVAIIAILSVRLKEDFLVDVALVYALLSFLTVVVMVRLVLVRHWRKAKCTKSEPGEKEAEEHGE
ncbi:hypothetical protein SDC9_126561 [bioreactor metagenome]|uniref:Na(+)/H(+) antiporter subunit F n=1 Tax=bioreactor metagenome TaxID=1076179 RepID=A0A645CRI0_9ZZZZ|nr:cation:proton antiporter [Oscillibacter sp.]